MKRITMLAASAAVLCVASSAYAVVLVPGSPETATPGSVANVTGLLAQQYITFTGVNALGQIRYTGLLVNQVYSTQSGGTLYTYFVHNDATSVAALSEVATTGFAGWTTDVDWATNSSWGSATANRVSSTADRSDVSDGGDIVSFYFRSDMSGKINPGDYTYALYIDTNAPSYNDQGTTNLIDGAVTTVQTYAPVPEPATLAALGIGFAALLRRRRK